MPNNHTMKFLSDKAIHRLQHLASIPNLEGTRYSLIEQVARGGMGIVYAAHDGKLSRRVALKVLDDAEPSGELARRLIREAQVLAQLEHPGIVPVHDVGILEDGRIFYTMKFVEGRRLDQHLETVASISDRLRIFLRVCDAVAFAHARGVLHRDLNPANIMIGPFGEVLVLDWGLAKVLREPADGAGNPDAISTGPADVPATSDIDPTQLSATTGHGAVMGTPGYMSPEQARGENDLLDERTDIFSLGALLHFLLSEAPPNAAQPVIDKSLRAICAKATAPDTTIRYDSVTALAGDVSRFLDGLPVTARAETPLDKAARFYRRHDVAILLIAAYLLVRVALLLFSRHSP
jgi:serine/threonine protein kinase